MEGCRLCQMNEGPMQFTEDDKSVYLIDEDVILEQLDIVEQFTTLHHIIIKDSTVRASKKKS